MCVGVLGSVLHSVGESRNQWHLQTLIYGCAKPRASQLDDKLAGREDGSVAGVEEGRMGRWGCVEEVEEGRMGRWGGRGREDGRWRG